MTSKLVVGFAPPLPNDSPVFRRDFDGLREGTGCCRGGIAGRWTKPVAASPVHGVASEAKSLSYVWGGRDLRAVAPRSDSANFPGFFSILCSVFRDSVVTTFRVISWNSPDFYLDFHSVRCDTS